eukprot:208049-Pyramimonas_sp.AAC.1
MVNTRAKHGKRLIILHGAGSTRLPASPRWRARAEAYYPHPGQGTLPSPRVTCPHPGYPALTQ